MSDRIEHATSPFPQALSATPGARRAGEPAYEANAYVIEVRGQTVGIVARDEQAFRFHASVHRYNTLDGRRFNTPREAEKAALSLWRDNSPGRRTVVRGRLALAPA